MGRKEKEVLTGKLVNLRGKEGRKGEGSPES